MERSKVVLDAGGRVRTFGGRSDVRGALMFLCS
jgi:hypothetical protein